jgi:putative sterol carrier protein
MSIENIKTILQQKLSMAAGFDSVIKLNLGDDGVLVCDAGQTPPVLSEEDTDECDLELITTAETFEGILNGTQDPNIAFMMGKLKVKGSMGLAMKLNGILED